MGFKEHFGRILNESNYYIGEFGEIKYDVAIELGKKGVLKLDSISLFYKYWTNNSKAFMTLYFYWDSNLKNYFVNGDDWEERSKNYENNKLEINITDPFKNFNRVFKDCKSIFDNFEKELHKTEKNVKLPISKYVEIVDEIEKLKPLDSREFNRNSGSAHYTYSETIKYTYYDISKIYKKYSESEIDNALYTYYHSTANYEFDKQMLIIKDTYGVTYD